jgi:cell cycle sensor histidine kinase DivJ
VSLPRPIRDYIESLVHPSARRNALTAARHRAFIAPRLFGSFAALAALPVYLLERPAPSGLEILVFAWLVAPILTAYFLSRTGRFEGAHVLSSLALTALVGVIAVQTGGIASFAAIWLVIVPLEAALSASRRVVIIASTLALGAAGLLVMLDATGSLPAAVTAPTDGHALAALGVVSAALYATGLAVGVEQLTRACSSLLDAEEDRYRLLAGNMTDVITRHGPRGAVLFASPAAEGLFGAPTMELLGHGLFDRVHVADRPAYLTALAEAAAQREVRSAEFRVRREGPVGGSRASFEFVWVEMHCRPLDRAVSDKQPAATPEVVAVMRDISERKEQEHRVEDARAEAERANAAKSRFLATMTHELRTPLNAIIGFSEMLLNEEQTRIDPARRKDYAQLIRDAGQHLLAVVNGILDMSKIEAGNFEVAPEPFAPAPALVNCCDMMALKAGEAGIILAVRVPSDLPNLVADKRALNQILLNLLSNAIKFTDHGGKIVVSATAEPATVAMTVEDTGIGIGEDDLAHLGEPFFQASSSYDRRHNGTGLGLSIVKSLIDLHGGQLEINSRLGHGTRVTVRLPRESADASPAKGASARPRTASRPTVVELETQVRKRA